MKILVTHGWSEQNTGDYAIEKSIINAINDQSSSENSFVFYSLFDKVDPRLKDHNQLKLQNSNIEMLASLWGTPPIQYSTIKKALYIFKSFLKSISILFLLTLGIKAHPAIRKFKEADLIVVKGGTFIYSIKGIRGIIFAFRIILPIIIATKLKKKTIIAPHSFGPFNNYLADKIIFRYLKKLDKVFSREEESVQFLKSKGLKNVSYIPDMAFYLENEHYKANSNKGTLKIGLTARPLDFVQKDKERIYKNYLGTLSQTIEYLASEHQNIQIQLIPQVIGPDPREDDYITLEQIYNSLSNEAKSKTQLLERKLRTPEELIGIYQNLNLLIGTRMHSVIFGLISGVKPIAISYLGPKHTGIMSSFGLSDFVESIESINYESLKSKIEAILPQDLEQKIRDKAISNRKDIKEVYRQIINI